VVVGKRRGSGDDRMSGSVLCSSRCAV